MKVFTKILDFIYPPLSRCVSCDMEHFDDEPINICPSCLRGIIFIEEVFCCRCGRPWPLVADEGGLCDMCRQGKYPFEIARTVAFYAKIMRDLIHRFKYEGEKHLARPLGTLMAYSCLSIKELRGADALVPIPMGKERLAARGYNQTQLLAQTIGQFTGLPVWEGLKRKKEVLPQGGLGKDERWSNIKGAFKAEAAPGKKFLLIDDVFTTGATVTEGAKALLEAGALWVKVLTLARQRKLKDQIKLSVKQTENSGHGNLYRRQRLILR